LLSPLQDIDLHQLAMAGKIKW